MTAACAICGSDFAPATQAQTCCSKRCRDEQCRQRKAKSSQVEIVRASKRLSPKEIKDGVELCLDDDLCRDMLGRPRTRADCIDGERPCPWVSCRYHLTLEVLQGGGLRIATGRPGVETCALDVADRGASTLEEIGDQMAITRERVRQIECAALKKCMSWAKKNGISKRDLAGLGRQESPLAQAAAHWAPMLAGMAKWRNEQQRKPQRKSPRTKARLLAEMLAARRRGGDE